MSWSRPDAERDTRSHGTLYGTDERGSWEAFFIHAPGTGLYDILKTGGGGEEEPCGGFTTDLPYYGDGFIFLTLGGDYDDYLGVFHEFSHFASFCLGIRRPACSVWIWDVSEIGSGDADAANALRGQKCSGRWGTPSRWRRYRILLDSIITGAMMDGVRARGDDTDRICRWIG